MGQKRHADGMKNGFLMMSIIMFDLDTGVSFIELLSQRTSGQLWSIIRNEQGLPYHTGLLLPLWSRLISDIQSRRAIGIWISCCDIDKEELPLLRHNTRIKKNCRWYSIGT
eukprot:190658_1